MKLGLIGIGHVAQFQIQAMQALRGIELVAGHDTDPEKAHALPANVQFYSSLDSLLERQDIELFLVSTPNDTHYRIGRKLLERGCRLLLEKPCCTSRSELDALSEIAKTRQTFFSVALHAAYARDLLWYAGQVKRGELDFGPLTGFYAGFFDPYYQSGAIISAARGLGGSWLDSGINALSVLTQLPDIDRLELVEGRMTVIDSLPCSQVQGTASFAFLSRGYHGHGLIETNWALNLNRKQTRLDYALSDTAVLLDHSAEKVSIRQGGRITEEHNFQTEHSRLTNHYINLFTDVKDWLHQNRSNWQVAAHLHRLLFQAIT